MENLNDLFKIIELTRSMPQTGYIMTGIAQDELSNLAEHHYLVSFIGWQIAVNLKAKGAGIDVRKVLEFCLVHDLGELFGGDISQAYADVNPKARELAKAFEAENQKFLAKFFGSEQNHFADLSKEIMNAESDESVLAKLADWIEIIQYKIYIKAFSEFDLKVTGPKLLEMAGRLKDPIAKEQMQKFLEQWQKELLNKNLADILYESKN